MKLGVLGRSPKKAKERLKTVGQFNMYDVLHNLIEAHENLTDFAAEDLKNILADAIVVVQNARIVANIPDDLHSRAEVFIAQHRPRPPRGQQLQERVMPGVSPYKLRA